MVYVSQGGGFQGIRVGGLELLVDSSSLPKLSSSLC